MVISLPWNYTSSHEFKSCYWKRIYESGSLLNLICLLHLYVPDIKFPALNIPSGSLGLCVLLDLSAKLLPEPSVACCLLLSCCGCSPQLDPFWFDPILIQDLVLTGKNIKKRKRRPHRRKAKERGKVIEWMNITVRMRSKPDLCHSQPSWPQPSHWTFLKLLFPPL